MWQEVKRTLKLGWPIILGNLTQMALGVIDSAMVGAIHSTQLAASSFVNNLIGIPLIVGMGMCMAISPLVAAAQGEGDNDKPLRILYNGFWVVGIVAILMATGLTVGIDIVDHMGQDEIVATLARPYLIWMAWGMLPMVFFLAIKQFADGLGYTRVAMYISLSALPINVLLNYAFIYGHWGAPRMELAGAGVGTLISRSIIMLAMGFFVMKARIFAPFRQNITDQLRLRMDRIRDIIRIGIPSSMQYGMESAAFAVSGIMAGWLGYIQQAAHQIAIHLAALSFMIPLGISAAGSIRVAFAYGKKNWAHARKIGTSTIAMAGTYGVLCGTFFILFRHQLPYLFNDEVPVIAYATQLLFLAAVFQISDSVQAIGVGLLRGLQDVKIPTYLVAIAYWVIGIPLGTFLAFKLNWDVSGIWIGLVTGLSFSAVFLSLRFLKITNRSHPEEGNRLEENSKLLEVEV